tara:strand:+ start:219 stop:503 length:285 start_codon:yes stop_codon:yes gene_type:complete
MKSQKGGHVAKRKSEKQNPRKILLNRVNEVEGRMGYLFQEIVKLNQNVAGLENLVMMLAEFLKKRDKFEAFLTKKIEEHEEELKSKEKNKEEAK